jgi:Putative restriction endonuclease
MTTSYVFDESQRAQTQERAPTRRPPKVEYPSEEPFEEHVAHTKSHSMACTVLERSIEESCPGISVGGDQFIYYVEGDPSQCLAPDVFVKLGKEIKNFDSWFTWEDGTPELAVEIVSAWDRMKLTWEEKLERYIASGIQELIRFDPKSENGIRIWDRVGNKFVERHLTPSRSATYECRALHLYWAVRVHPDYGRQLRLARDREGKDLLPTPSETVLELTRQITEERAARSQAEHDKRISEQKQRDAVQKQRDAVQKQRDAEQKQRDAELKQRDAELKQRDAELKQRDAELKQRDEAEARLLAEHKQREEAEARLLAEKKQRDEAEARLLAEQKQREEAEARLLAEKKLRDAEAQVAALLAELERRTSAPRS